MMLLFILKLMLILILMKMPMLTFPAQWLHTHYTAVQCTVDLFDDRYSNEADLDAGARADADVEC